MAVMSLNTMIFLGLLAVLFAFVVIAVVFIIAVIRKYAGNKQS
jgi:hypothetical protein